MGKFRFQLARAIKTTSADLTAPYRSLVHLVCVMPPGTEVAREG